MFCVSESEATAIRRVFSEEGELSAVIEFRRHFPGIEDNAKARECVRIIAGWTPRPDGYQLPAKPQRKRKEKKINPLNVG